MAASPTVCKFMDLPARNPFVPHKRKSAQSSPCEKPVDGCQGNAEDHRRLGGRIRFGDRRLKGRRYGQRSSIRKGQCAR